VSGKCTVAKRLIGCRLGDKWGQSSDGCIRWGGDRQRRDRFWGEFGHPIVTNGVLLWCIVVRDDALFLNYFGEDLF